MIAGGLAWDRYWAVMGVAGLAVAALLFFLLSKPEAAKRKDSWIKGPVTALAAVFKNPQSILCGLLAGLFFIPTTIFDMIWGVRFLQEGHGFDYAQAVIRSATVPFGWILGSPLMGMLSDRLGRRKPVIVFGGCMLMGSLLWILYGPKDVLPPYVLGFSAGFASGAAMVTYTVVKEANPPQFGGTATGVIGFLNFTFSALIGPVFGSRLQRFSGGLDSGLEQYQMTFQPLIYGVALAVLLTVFLLKETGPAARVPAAKAEAA
jgi:MFS family permease